MMTKTNSILLLLLSFAIFPGSISGQTAMFDTKALSEKLDDYCHNAPLEDIYIHSDRKTYCAGEDIWFKVYMVDRETMRLSDHSSFAYVDLVNADNISVAQTKVLLKNGTGGTLLALPDTLANGTYILRAYTFLIKNAMPNARFTRKLTILNPFSERYSDLYDYQSRDSLVSNVYFFPEGGQLLTGLNNKVGVFTINKSGILTGAHASVYNSKGELITNVTIDSTGVGEFEIQPVEGMTYFLTDSITGRSYMLPAQSETAFSISPRENNADRLILSVKNNFDDIALSGSHAFVIVRKGKRITYSTLIPLGNNSSTVNIPAAKLSPGINDIVLLDQEGKLISERMILREPEPLQKTMINCTGSSGKREKIRIEIGIPELLGMAEDNAELSLSVALSPEPVNTIGIDEYMVSGNEYRIPVPGTVLPELLASVPACKRDIIMMAAQNTWIDWEKILSGEILQDQYCIEKNGQYLTVIYSDEKGRHPDKNSIAVITSPGKIAEMQYSVPDADFRYKFFLRTEKQPRNLVLQHFDSTANFSVKIENQFFENHSLSSLIPDTTRKSIPDDMVSLCDNYQIQKIYQNSSRGEITDPGIANPEKVRFYGKPDQELIMRDYISLPTMREVFYELIPRAAIRTKKGSGSQIIDYVTKKSFTLFVDGVFVDDPEVIINMNPERVEQIDVLTSEYRVGDIIFPCLINVITKKGDFSDVALAKNSIRIPFRHYDPEYTFAAPDYQTEGKREERIPDFRNTLYWNPHLKADESGKYSVEFWTSDFSSEYLITFQGITSGGKVFSSSKRLTVR